MFPFPLPPFSNTPNIESFLLCPISHEPLRQAVTIIPCSHKVQQAIAESVLGKPEANTWRTSNKKCPVCSEPAEGYVVDLAIRDIANRVFSMRSPHINPSSNRDFESFFFNHLSQDFNELNSSSSSAEPASPIPYPGKSGTFTTKWEDRKLGGDLCREIEFTSTVEDSLIKEFSLLGYTCGNLSIYLKFNSSNLEEIQTYFTNQGNPLNFSPFEKENYCYRSQGKKELQQIFKVIKEHNTISEEHLNELEAIISAGKITLPDPEICANFVYEKGNWESFDQKKERFKQMDFKSTTPNSLINEFSVIQDINKITMIHIKFQQSNLEKIKEYFQKKGLELKVNSYEMVSGQYISNNIRELEIIFEAIKKDSIIPTEYSAKLQEIVDEAKTLFPNAFEHSCSIQ